MNSTLSELCDWYRAQCNDDWEHQYGIKIETLDNPGWSLTIDLTDTPFANRPFDPVDFERSQIDWIYAKKDENVLFMYGGPGNLEEMIGCFLAWTKSFNIGYQ